MKCRGCRSENTTEVMCLERVPPNVQALLNKEQLGRVKPVEFHIYQCDDCGLVQAPQVLSDEYYDDYLMSQTFTTQLSDYLESLVADVGSRHDIFSGKVLDVGCGDGAFMYPFKNRGVEVVGIEPSDKSRAVSLTAGFKVHPGYMTADTELPDGPFNVFITRQVLEHVPDITDMLAGVRRNLAENAIGIIEIPRLEKALEDLRFYDFFPDHLNYFSLPALRNTLENNGFEVLELFPTMFDEYNVAVVRLRTPVSFVSLKNNVTELTRAIENLFALEKMENKTTAIWGSGAKGLSIMSAMNVQDVDYVIDSDPNKIGRYTPVSEILVQDPHILLDVHVDVIVISAVAYQGVIVDKLRNKLNFKGDIYLIKAHGLERVE